jgi:hypothetical protein
LLFIFRRPAANEAAHDVDRHLRVKLEIPPGLSIAIAVQATGKRSTCGHTTEEGVFNSPF